MLSDIIKKGDTISNIIKERRSKKACVNKIYFNAKDKYWRI